MTRSATGIGACALFVAQAIASLTLPPSPSDSYTGTLGDIANDSLFAAGLLLLAAFLLQKARGAAAWPTRGFSLAALGCLLISVSILATIVAGSERWEIAFILGFALAEVGLVVTLLGRRSAGVAAMLVGIVLTLAFFDAAGGLVLGGAVLLLVREGHRKPVPATQP